MRVQRLPRAQVAGRHQKAAEARRGQLPQQRQPLDAAADDQHVDCHHGTDVSADCRRGVALA